MLKKKDERHGERKNVMFVKKNLDLKDANV
jgi:hypothetical protein